MLVNLLKSNKVKYFSTIPDPLKLSNIVPVEKTEDTTDKKNYSSVSVLSLQSQIFEKVMYEQLYEYLNNYLNDVLCGFCKAHSTQYVMPRLIQSLKKGARQFRFRRNNTLGPLKGI